MRKMLVGAITAVLLFGGAQTAFAGHSDDRPDHKPQDKGLCTAYHNGNKNGWAKNGTPGPFQDLEQRADDADEETTNDVASYCGALIGGNPGPNGNSEGKGNGGN